jgi:LPXTG-motif cell wall-anchored protein
VTYDAAPGGDVLSYRINGITYEAEKTDGVITGFLARGPIGEDGTVTLKIRECDSLRIVNVPIGTSYTVEEVVDETSDFEFKETHWEVKKGGNVYEDKTATLNTVSTTQTIVPDAENNVVFRNKPKVPTKDLTIMKTGANDAGLPGATFQLLVKNEAGIYGPVLAADGYADILFDGNPLQTITIGKLTKSSTFTTNGTAQVLSALPIGGYKILELQAPDGYIVSSAEIEFAVTVRGISMITESDLLHFEEETDNASAQLTVNNASGESLPNTGGPGTGSLYLFGFTLTCVAAAGLVMKRRRRAA